MFHAIPNGQVSSEKRPRRNGREGAGRLVCLVEEEEEAAGLPLSEELADCVLDATSCSSFSRALSCELLASYTLPTALYYGIE